jgi:hypothetical protein
MAMTADDHARAIAKLPERTREVVLNAIRVRAMDFVTDRLDDDVMSDDCADIYRATFPDADAAMAFDPEHY